MIKLSTRLKCVLQYIRSSVVQVGCLHVINVKRVRLTIHFIIYLLSWFWSYEYKTLSFLTQEKGEKGGGLHPQSLFHILSIHHYQSRNVMAINVLTLPRPLSTYDIWKPVTPSHGPACKPYKYNIYSVLLHSFKCFTDLLQLYEYFW